MTARAPMSTLTRMPRGRAEDAIQASIISYLEAVLPGCVVHANANAARRTDGGRAANAVAGLLPGIPDLCVDYPYGQHLYFEVKTPTGVLSDVQRDVIARLRHIGCRVDVVTGINDVRDALKAWGVATREVAA